MLKMNQEDIDVLSPTLSSHHKEKPVFIIPEFLLQGSASRRSEILSAFDISIGNNLEANLDTYNTFFYSVNQPSKICFEGLSKELETRLKNVMSSIDIRTSLSVSEIMLGHIGIPKHFSSDSVTYDFINLGKKFLENYVNQKELEGNTCENKDVSQILLSTTAKPYSLYVKDYSIIIVFESMFIPHISNSSFRKLLLSDLITAYQQMYGTDELYKTSIFNIYLGQQRS